MSDAAEEVMDGSAVSGEELEQTELKQTEQKQRSSLWGVGEIIEGKRAKKSVSRLDIQAPKKKILTIGEGSGEKLGEIPRTCFYLNKMKPADLVPLHSLLFDRRGKLSLIKKNLRLFSGFPFDTNSEQFNKKREKLQKNLTNTKLRLMCEVLDLEKKGTHSDLVDRIMTFLMSPKSTGKRLPKKKKRSKKNLSGDDSKPKKTSKKRKSSSGTPKKQKPTSTSPKKSKAIVMETSSDEEDEEEEQEEERAMRNESDESGAESGDKQEEEEEQSEEEEEESPRPKARAKAKKTATKKQTTKERKKPAKKRNRKELTDSESEESDSEPQKKKSKPAAKTKAADSSSSRKISNSTGSSDEDLPLSKMIHKSPSDEQLQETVKELLQQADLEQLTMKQICQKVFDVYSDHDLSSKKDFIKQTVKSLIT